MKKWVQDINGLLGLNYIQFKCVPMRDSQYGPVIDLDPMVLEKMAGAAIIKEKIPIRGKEVLFLRKILGLSMERFAAKFGLSSGTIFHWEKNENERLSTINEMAVRSLMAQELAIEISGKFFDLSGGIEHLIEVKIS